MLWTTGQRALINLIALFSAAQVPVLLIDIAVTSLVVATLGRSLPSVLPK
jgi:ABC-type Co2+ transport system permease subunit